MSLKESLNNPGAGVGSVLGQVREHPTLFNEDAPFGNNSPRGEKNDQFVIKRDGRKEPVQFDKITARIRALCHGLDSIVRPHEIALSVITEMPNNEIIKTTQLDQLAYEKAASMATRHPDFDTLAARIAINNHHKNTKKRFSEVMISLYENNGMTDDKGRRVHYIRKDIIDFIKQHADELDSMILYQRDYNNRYSGFKTLESMYFMKIDDQPVERFQHVLMRVAIEIHRPAISEKSSPAISEKSPDDSLKYIKETYDLMSQGFFIHATPTLFNAGSPAPQLASCFLLSCEDSVQGMYNKLVADVAHISKYAGGIGIDFSNVRSTGAKIRLTGGESTGLVRFLKVIDPVTKHINQASRRNGAVAAYYPPWHPEIRNLLNLKKDQTKDEMRAKSLFYALWIDDVFMKRAEADQMYSLMDPDECPGLSDAFGAEFEALYTKYESEKKYREQVNAQELLKSIIDSQIETGTPYVLFKDHVNRKNNQANLGTIRCSNLCVEIVQYSSPDEYSVCNLASISLPAFVNVAFADSANAKFDFEKLHKVVKVVVRNIDNVIDKSFYPVERTVQSNKNNRPMGIGVQGLSDLYNIMHFPFESEDAMKLNVQIFERMYYAALEASHELALERGRYNSFEGSPISKGLFQHDLWDNDPNTQQNETWKSYRQIPAEKWNDLRQKIIKDGVRNSLLIALMPTASTSFIVGNSECIEPLQSNLFKRKTSSGEFITFNKYMIADLIKIGKWTDQIREQIMVEGGSVQGIDIPPFLKQIYKTSWEIKQRAVIDQSAARGPFIDQTQSLNLHYEGPTIAKITSALFHAWKLGLKTAVYYTRTRVVRAAQKVTLSSYGSPISEKSDQPSENKSETYSKLATIIESPRTENENVGSPKKEKVGSSLKDRFVSCDGDMCTSCSS